MGRHRGLCCKWQRILSESPPERPRCVCIEEELGLHAPRACTGSRWSFHEVGVRLMVQTSAERTICVRRLGADTQTEAVVLNAQRNVRCADPKDSSRTIDCCWRMNATSLNSVTIATTTTSLTTGPQCRNPPNRLNLQPPDPLEYPESRQRPSTETVCSGMAGDPR
jgi:hypothetical protein